MRTSLPSVGLLALLVAANACGPTSGADADAGAGDGAVPGDGVDPTSCGSGDRTACAAAWEQAASAAYDAALGDGSALAAFLTAVPKGGDLHNHLSGAVYGETLLDWGAADGDCIGSTSDTAVLPSSCSASNVAIPSSGSFYDAILAAWSMKDFVAGAQNGHDHFFATFGKFGLIAGYHRNDSIADLAKRAAAENEIYIETMFNLGKNTGSLASSLEGGNGALGSGDLQTLYTKLTTDAGFAAAVAKDVADVTSAQSGYRAALGCSAASPPAACGVQVRFVAQIARTGADAQVFGQLIGAFEMAKTSPYIVAADLSSPEDDASSIANYDIQMQMLAFLRAQHTATGASPLHVTLHAGELVPKYLPANSTANTYHIRAAVEIAQAERVGHGVDVMSESDPSGLMDEMAQKHVMVEVCLSSNTQILEISGTAHPLAQYLAHGVPVALATDDQGVSRSSLAGEYQRAALDQHLTYVQLKAMARTSLEHAFLPGPSLWTTVGTAPVGACAPSPAMAIGDPPTGDCAAYLATSERATAQWELERRFLAFESQQ